MVVQLRRNCPKLLKMVNGQRHATDQHHEPAVKKEECKEMTEVEVNQSPRSSISDGNFSSKEGEMSPHVGSLSKFPGCAVDTPISPLKLGSAPRDFRVPYGSWDTDSQRKRKRNRNTYSAIKNDSPLRAAEKKTTGGSDVLHGSDHRQGSKRKKSSSLSTQGRSTGTCLCGFSLSNYRSVQDAQVNPHTTRSLCCLGRCS